MLFQSPLFFLFFSVLIAILWCCRGKNSQHLVLLLSSYLFYSAWDIRYLILIIASTCVDYFVGLLLRNSSNKKRKILLWSSIATNLGILGAFKYYNFFVDSAATLANFLGFQLSDLTLHVTLPVGISFYTFQSMSYTIDVYRGRIPAEKSFTRFALFVAFFPQLVAGPIVRASHFLPQLNTAKRVTLKNLSAGLVIFSYGALLKIFCADWSGKLVDRIFEAPEFFSSLALAFGNLLYAFQIYCDFAGYSLMAIGVARILGYRLPRNFNRPYSSCSIREFWQRWHISLSTWLRDYLYISLGGNKQGRLRTYLNLLTTMVLGGLWHGAHMRFIVWGFMHGIALAIERMLGFSAKSFKALKPLGWIYSMLVVYLGWLLFRAPDFNFVLEYLTLIASNNAAVEHISSEETLLYLLISLLIVLDQTKAADIIEQKLRRLRPNARLCLSGFLLTLAYTLSLGETRAFIYFQF